MGMVVALQHELVGPVMVSPSEVDRESVGCYEAWWVFASECASIVRGKGPPSQLGAWWVCHSGWGVGGWW
jgi:hypothetical protein